MYNISNKNNVMVSTVNDLDYNSILSPSFVKDVAKKLKVNSSLEAYMNYICGTGSYTCLGKIHPDQKPTTYVSLLKKFHLKVKDDNFSTMLLDDWTIIAQLHKHYRVMFNTMGWCYKRIDKKHELVNDIIYNYSCLTQIYLLKYLKPEQLTWSLPLDHKDLMIDTKLAINECLTYNQELNYLDEPNSAELSKLLSEWDTLVVKIIEIKETIIKHICCSLTNLPKTQIHKKIY